jgi:hypothetical protein
MSSSALTRWGLSSGVAVVLAGLLTSGSANAVTPASGQPIVTRVSPARGTAYQLVVIHGTNFSDATQVLFGSVPAAQFTVESATEVYAVAPREDAGPVDVQVTTPVGTSAISVADQFRYVAPPVLQTTSYSVVNYPSYAASVSCPRAGWCASTDEIGGTTPGRGIGLTVVAGQQQRNLSVPLPPDGVPDRASIGAISCAAPGSCVAVGTPDYKRDAMIVTLDGRSVTSVDVTIPKDQHRAFLTDVSCTSALCVAVGGDDNEATFVNTGAVFERGADGAWSEVASAKSVLETVSCAGTSCVAVRSGNAHSVLVRAGGAWHASSIPAPPGGRSVVAHDVDCYAQETCVVSAAYTASGNAKRQLFARWDGDTWTTIAVPAAPTVTGTIAAGPLDCTADGVCFAASTGTAASSPATFVARLNGNAVSVSSLPIPTDRGTVVYSVITDLSCSFDSYCVTDGYFVVDDLEFGPAYYDTEVLSGGVWSYADATRSEQVSCAPTRAFCGLASDASSRIVMQTLRRQ